jgi:hypothetical protein
MPRLKQVTRDASLLRGTAESSLTTAHSARPTTRSMLRSSGDAVRRTTIPTPEPICAAETKTWRRYGARLRARSRWEHRQHLLDQPIRDGGRLRLERLAVPIWYSVSAAKERRSTSRRSGHEEPSIRGIRIGSLDGLRRNSSMRDSSSGAELADFAWSTAPSPGPAHLRRQVHTVAHPGGDDVDERGNRRRHQPKPARLRLRADRGLRASCCAATCWP